jgi:uncharacterized protein (TIGR03083 family)
VPLELRFALAEGDAVPAPAGLRDRVVAASTADRPAGRAHGAPDRISGAEALHRAVARVDGLLGELTGEGWATPTAHYPSVQAMVGHLVGVEAAFASVLAGGADPGAGVDHRDMTEPAIADQLGRPPADTHADWSGRAAASVAAVAGRAADEPIAFYGTTLPLDQLLVLRSFELWIHEEDVRRAVGRPLADPDGEVLARMVEVAVQLLPFGTSAAGRGGPGRTARLVLTGPSGGTFDVNLDGAPEVRPADARVVIDAASFCRVIGNREDAAAAGALVTGDAEVADDALVGAAALALD